VETSTGDHSVVTYVIVDPAGVPLSDFTPFTDLVDALRAARAHGSRNTVMKQQDGKFRAMAHQGPGGWRPKRRKDED
jgi:hypothetical protein